MAEFVEVMKQAQRMCKNYFKLFDACVGCPANDEGICTAAPNLSVRNYAEAECRIMDWSAEHPEPVYPNWKEAWKKLFPNAREVPCPRKYFDEGCFPIFICAKHDCDRCKALQMDPEIAEKLGIRPIEIKKPASCGTCKYSDKSVWEAPCGTCKRAHGDCYPDQREGENDAEVH